MCVQTLHPLLLLLLLLLLIALSLLTRPPALHPTPRTSSSACQASLAVAADAAVVAAAAQQLHLHQSHTLQLIIHLSIHFPQLVKHLLLWLPNAPPCRLDAAAEHVAKGLGVALAQLRSHFGV
jgi:hypothetical protein